MLDDAGGLQLSPAEQYDHYCEWPVGWFWSGKRPATNGQLLAQGCQGEATALFVPVETLYSGGAW